MDNTIPQNLDSEQKKSSPQAGQTGIQDESKRNAEDTVFFNVMPKTAFGSGIIEPKIKVASSFSTLKEKTGFWESAKKKKWYVIGVACLAVAGIAIYFLIVKFGGTGYEEENLLVKNSGASSTPEKIPGQQVNQIKDYTTPKEWRDKYFTNCTDAKICGDDADPDNDGLTNLQENKLGTDPNNKDSDQDGLADGDEVNIFATDPLNSHTGKDPKHSDADFIKGGFNIQTNQKMTASEISVISAKINQNSIHEPTISTLDGYLKSLYGISPPNSLGSASQTQQNLASSSVLSGFDQSVDAKQGRDAKRSDTIKNIEIALIKYKTDNKTYPLSNDFNVMYSEVKLYLKVATNPIDPINKDPYVYSYNSNADGSNFTLSFYSEVAGQTITKNSDSAVKDAASEENSIYDNQRQSDLESLRIALLVYSQNNVAGNQDYVFPTKDKYKTAIVPQYITEIPKDPKTGLDYDYQVSPTFNTFTLKTLLDSPPVGTTGYVCNQDSCQNY